MKDKKKILIIAHFKLLNIIKNPQLLSTPCLAIGFCWILANYMPEEQLEQQPLFIITTGLIFSIAMGGIMLAALPLAADKENGMLRVLMVSTVSPTDYLIGSILPSFLVIFITNLIIGMAWLPERIPLVFYMLISIVTTLISMIIGFVIGLFSTNQMTASSTCIPIVFIFALIPILKVISKDFEKYSQFLYTSQMINYLTNIYNHKNSITAELIIVFSVTFLLTLLISIYGYSRNRFD